MKYLFPFSFGSTYKGNNWLPQIVFAMQSKTNVTVNAQKFRTLYSKLVWPKFCFFYVVVSLNIYLVEWQTV